MLTLTEAETEKLADAIKSTLYERFKDAFVFDPIVIRTKTDYYGDDYLHIYIIYEGDRANLDSKWTLGLIGRIEPTLDELGIPGVPSKSFVPKFEWKGMPAGVMTNERYDVVVAGAGNAALCAAMAAADEGASYVHDLRT